MWWWEISGPKGWWWTELHGSRTHGDQEPHRYRTAAGRPRAGMQRSRGGQQGRQQCGGAHGSADRRAQRRGARRAQSLARCADLALERHHAGRHRRHQRAQLALHRSRAAAQQDASGRCAGQERGLRAAPQHRQAGEHPAGRTALRDGHAAAAQVAPGNPVCGQVGRAGVRRLAGLEAAPVSQPRRCAGLQCGGEQGAGRHRRS